MNLLYNLIVLSAKLLFGIETCRGVFLRLREFVGCWRSGRAWVEFKVIRKLSFRVLIEHGCEY